MSDMDTLRTAELVANNELVGVPLTNLLEHVRRLYRSGLPPGDKTGWPSVDKLYTVMPGQLTILTGWPGSGKSEWLDALLINLGKLGWRHAVFSPENSPAELHASKLVEKFLGMPFSAGPTPRMSEDEALEAATELSEWFHLLLPTATTQRTSFNVGNVLDAAEAYFRVQGWWKSNDVKRSVVIDPWNTLEHWRPNNQTETEYVSWTLSHVLGWARESNTHVFIVAHPQKLRREESGKLPVPRPDNISGSQHWWNKADNCITVFREFDDRQDVQIHVQKIRFKHIGRIGMTTLKYDRVTGRYNEPLTMIHGNGVPTW